MKLTIENYHEKASHKEKFPQNWPEFASYVPPISEIKKQFSAYSNYKNIVVIGNGGSISTLNGFRGALSNWHTSGDRSLEIVSTMEPDYLREVQSKYHQKDTLVIAISKSGTTVGVIEALMAFKNYQVVCITSVGEGTLSAIAQALGWAQVEHPAIGGRFSGRTAVGYGPAYLLGADIEEIEKGAKGSIEKNMAQNGPAWRFAKFLYERELDGDADIFMPVYSHFLVGFNHLVTQLIHESAGKNGKGQTILTVEAPESQHHTNQRYFGGAKNMVGVFVTVNRAKHDIKIEIPEEVENLSLRSGVVGDMNHSSLEHSLHCEADGTMADAREQGRPFAHIELEDLSEKSIGEYMVFWQFVAYFSALLRDVNPLDQPQVERSKEIALDLRKKLK